MEQDRKIDYKKRFVSKRQTLWNYMRRNRQFRVGDVMLLFEVSYSYFQMYLRFLERAEYVQFIGKKKNPYTHREYKLIKNTGVKAPIITDYGLFDFNTNEPIRLVENEIEPNIYAPKNLIQILESINYDEATQEQMAEKANLKRTALSKWWKRLEKTGVIKGKILADLSHVKEWEKVRYAQYKLIDRKYVFEINQERAKEILTELQKGSYTSTNAELRHLWLEN